MSYKGKRGIHDDWIAGEGLEKICEWASFGLTDKQIVENIGIGRTTFYKWLREYPDFADAIKKARVKANIEIENAMIDLACGKKFVEETKTVLDSKTGQVIRIEKTRKQIPPSAVMLIFLAKNRMRDKYKDYAPIPFEPHDTDEQQDVQIYLPDNGRDMNDSKTSKRSTGKISVH